MSFEKVEKIEPAIENFYHRVSVVSIKTEVMKKINDMASKIADEIISKYKIETVLKEEIGTAEGQIVIVLTPKEKEKTL